MSARSTNSEKKREEMLQDTQKEKKARRKKRDVIRGIDTPYICSNNMLVREALVEVYHCIKEKRGMELSLHRLKKYTWYLSVRPSNQSPKLTQKE